MSWLYGFVQFLLISSDGLSLGIMMEIILGKDHATPGRRIFRIGMFWLLIFLICLPSYLAKSKILPLINNMFFALGTVVLIHWLYQATYKKGMLLFVAAFLCQIAGEAACFLSFPAEAAIPYDWTVDPYIPLLLRALFLSAGMKLIFATLYRCKESGKLRRDPVQILFCLFLIVFASMLPSLYYAMSGQGQYSFSNQDTFSLFACMVSVLILAGVAFLFQNRKAQQKLENLEMLKTVQDDYYSSLEKNSMTMSKLRHDYLNILQPVGRYVKEKRNDEALRLIEDLTGKIRETGQQNRCGIPVVNAILTEKEQLCLEKGIRFAISIRFIEDCHIPDLELCRVFGNLLDNAIRACERIDDPDQRWIELRASMAQQHLIVSCCNARNPNEKKQIFGTGLGQNILKEMARQFEGHFNVDDSNPEQYICSIDLLDPTPRPSVFDRKSVLESKI